jgi:hypothetical protein
VRLENTLYCASDSVSLQSYALDLSARDNLNASAFQPDEALVCLPLDGTAAIMDFKVDFYSDMPMAAVNWDIVKADGVTAATEWVPQTGTFTNNPLQSTGPTTPGEYRLRAWVDCEGGTAGVRDSGERYEAVKVWVGDLSSVSASRVANPGSGDTTVTDATDAINEMSTTNSMYIVESNGVARLWVTASWTPTNMPGRYVKWAVMPIGRAVALTNGDFSASASTEVAWISQSAEDNPTRQYKIVTWLESRNDGAPQADEVQREVYVTVLKVELLKIWETMNKANQIYNPTKKDDRPGGHQELGLDGEGDVTKVPAKGYSQNRHFVQLQTDGIPQLAPNIRIHFPHIEITGKKVS